MCANYGSEVLHMRVENLKKINQDLTNIYRDIAKNNDKHFVIKVFISNPPFFNTN